MPCVTLLDQQPHGAAQFGVLDFQLDQFVQQIGLGLQPLGLGVDEFLVLAPLQILAATPSALTRLSQLLKTSLAIPTSRNRCCTVITPLATSRSNCF